jgi:(R,R)-butanediol dehydrogenase / meso-butanediol dehydrogenase / diacetyl reductase
VGTCDFPFWPITWREQSIIPSMGYSPYEFALGLELLATKKVNGECLITGRIKLQDIVEKGFKVLAGPQRADHIKMVVAP